jgi:ubiquinone/menaquinone biosynthesis C-methylase UbiE
MGLEQYRESDSERARTDDLLRLIPICGGVALDVGARDGHFSKLLAEKFDNVIALDLEQPSIEHQKIRCAKGNASDLHFKDASFDLVFCAEGKEIVVSA